PLERPAAGAAAALVETARRHAAERVIDLSDEPVLDQAARFRLASHALAAGLSYRGADFELWPPPRAPSPAPALEIVGTGKRIGKTAICAHAARTLAAAFARDARGEIVIVAMGR